MLRTAKLAVVACFGLVFGVKFVAVGAIQALVFALVDVAVLPHPPPKFLGGALVVIVSGADPVVVGEAVRREGRLEFVDDVVNVPFNGQAALFRRALDVQSVLIGPGQKEGLEAALTLVASHRVGDQRRVKVAEMRMRVDVIYRRCNVELVHAHFPRYERKQYFFTMGRDLANSEAASVMEEGQGDKEKGRQGEGKIIFLL